MQTLRAQNLDEVLSRSMDWFSFKIQSKSVPKSFHGWGSLPNNNMQFVFVCVGVAELRPELDDEPWKVQNHECESVTIQFLPPTSICSTCFLSLHCPGDSAGPEWFRQEEQPCSKFPSAWLNKNKTDIDLQISTLLKIQHSSPSLMKKAPVPPRSPDGEGNIEKFKSPWPALPLSPYLSSPSVPPSLHMPTMSSPLGPALPASPPPPDLPLPSPPPCLLISLSTCFTARCPEFCLHLLLFILLITPAEVLQCC